MTNFSPEYEPLYVPEEFYDVNNPYEPYYDGIMVKKYSDGIQVLKFPPNAINTEVLHTKFKDGVAFEGSVIPNRYAPNKESDEPRDEFSRKADLIREISTRVIVATEDLTDEYLAILTINRQDFSLYQNLPDKSVSKLQEILDSMPDSDPEF
jgi:hypothetical protein